MRGLDRQKSVCIDQIVGAEYGSGIDIDQAVNVGRVVDLWSIANKRTPTAEPSGDFHEYPPTVIAVPNGYVTCGICKH